MCPFFKARHSKCQQDSVHEEADQLLYLMKQQKNLRQRLRVQALYLLQSGEATSITQAAQIVGYDRSTVQRWLLKYQQLGLSGLLDMTHGGGRQTAIPPWAQTQLRVRLNQPEALSAMAKSPSSHEL